jgi:hypothetical protein
LDARDHGANTPSLHVAALRRGTPHCSNRYYGNREEYDRMPNERTDKQRADHRRQQPAELKLPQPPAHQIAPPLIVEGPEAVRDSHC